LQHLQRILDPLDIEGLSWLWRDHYGGNLFDGIEAIDPALIDWQSFIGEFSKNAGSKLTCLDGIEEEQVRFYVMSYLLSASFKDCSVIIRCPHEPEDEAELFIIDLDPKTTRSLRKWFYLDNKIATFCRDAVPCVDDHTL
jgi:inositol-pentakisphosphate 2-kinase